MQPKDGDSVEYYMLMLISMVALLGKMRRLTGCIAMSVNVVSVNGSNQCSLLALVQSALQSTWTQD